MPFNNETPQNINIKARRVKTEGKLLRSQKAGKLNLTQARRKTYENCRPRRLQRRLTHLLSFRHQRRDSHSGGLCCKLVGDPLVAGAPITPCRYVCGLRARFHAWPGTSPCVSECLYAYTEDKQERTPCEGFG